MSLIFEFAIPASSTTATEATPSLSKLDCNKDPGY